MKRLSRIAFAALAITALYACNDIRENVESVSGVETHLVFTATHEGISPDTKTQRMDDGSTWWNASEEISVFYGSGSNGGSKFTSLNNTFQEIVEFDGSIQMSGAGKNFWAVYPYSEDNECDGNSITTVIPSVQTASEGNFSGDAFPTVALSKTLDLAFWNICGGIKFFVSRSDIKSITFKGNNGETLAGKVKVAFDASGVPEVTEVIDGKSEVTLTAPDGGTFKAGKYYYLTLLPTALNSGFTMMFVTANETGFLVTNKSQSLKRSVFGVLGEIDSKVKDWTELYNIRGVGDIVEADGLGVVVYIEVGRALLMSVEEIYQKNWEDSNEWCRSYGYGWRMPTIDELSLIHSNFTAINQALSSNGYTTLTTGNYCHWSSTQNPKNSNYYYRERLHDGYILTNTGAAEHKNSTSNFTRAVKEITNEGSGDGDESTTPVESVTLNKTELSLYLGRTEKLTATVLPENATDKTLTWSSDKVNVATVDEKGNVTAKAVGSATITVTTTLGVKTAACTVTVVEQPKLEAVDLGLPSGLKWASWNVGATAPEEYGEYYAWGETEPKSKYVWSTYKFELGTDYRGPFSKYDPEDNKTVLESVDDAARVNWGSNWCMPTYAEWTELINNCTWTWTTQNGVNGRLVTGANGNSIFLPAAGYRYDASLRYAGDYGRYWSSSFSGNPSACYLDFTSNSKGTGHMNRFYGLSVRPVYSDKVLEVRPESVTFTRTLISLSVGHTEQILATVLPEDATYKTLTWSSDKVNVATVDENGNVTAIAVGMATITATTTHGAKTATCTVIVIDQPKLEAVDLGLPSGLKWAPWNVGATAPEEYGDYYAWGEVETKYGYDTGYTWDRYKWCKGNKDILTKYNNRSALGAVDYKTVLDPEDDVAHVNWGDSWRMPTRNEWGELINNCAWIWTTLNGVKGRLVNGPNGNSIFLPSAGRHGASNQSRGLYWSASLYDDPHFAYNVVFTSGELFLDHQYRCDGYLVRPVSD